MKIAVIADTHFGCRKDSKAFHDRNELFFTNVFFPTLKKEKVKKVIHVGDVFDNRKMIDMSTAARAREYFFTPLAKAKIDMDVIAGNHDLYYRESSKVTTLKELLNFYPNITCYTNPSMSYEGFAYIPWINKENRQQTLNFIEENASKDVIAFGHLELKGYQMYRGTVATHGDDPITFKGFGHVYTGHFHTPSSMGNVTYLGSTGQYTWQDHLDNKGFHLFDTETGEMTFVENPYKMFAYIQYEDGMKADGLDVEGMYIRVRHGEVAKQSNLDKFVRSLEEQGAVDVKTIGSKIAKETVDNEESVDVEDTFALFRDSTDDEKVLKILIDLYNRAESV